MSYKSTRNRKGKNDENHFYPQYEDFLSHRNFYWKQTSCCYKVTLSAHCTTGEVGVQVGSRSQPKHRMGDHWGPPADPGPFGLECAGPDLSWYKIQK